MVLLRAIYMSETTSHETSSLQMNPNNNQWASLERIVVLLGTPPKVNIDYILRKIL